MKKIILGLALAVIVTGCASSEKVREIDTSIDKKGQVLNGDVGLNDKGEAIIQKQSAADDELRGLVWQNNQLESDLSSEAYMLNWCREDLADPRLGGSGDVVEIPEIDNMKPTTDLKEELGLVGGRLVVVSKESFTQRLASEKAYQTSLEKMIKQVSKNRKSCEIKMGMARRKAGLQSSRYQGQIKVTPQGTVGEVLAPHEHNLDDAFRIKSESKGSTRSPATESLQEE